MALHYTLPVLAVLASISLRAQSPTSCSCWVEPDSTWTFLGHPYSQPIHLNLWQVGGMSGVPCHGPVALPFQFQFHGQLFDSVYINAVGVLSFGQPWGVTAQASFPIPSAPAIAPFWSNGTVLSMQVSPTSPLWNTVNIVAYKLTAHALVVSWENIGQSPLDLDSLNSFQVAITDGSDPLAPDGNNVSFCYREVQWVVGNQFGLDPSPATVGTNWGNGVDFMQVGRFGFTDSVWNGQMTWSGSGWLNGRHVAFNAGPLPVPPFYSTKECDTVEVNVGDTGHYVITAHRGGPAPPMSAYSTCSSLTNYTVANQTVDGSHVLTSTFIPVEGEEGLHTMYFQASKGIGLPSTTQRYIKVNGPFVSSP